MKQFVAGLVAGVLLMWVVPVRAHHNPEFSKLRNRVADLEDAFDRGCSWNQPVTWGSSLGNPVGDPTLRCGQINADDIDVPAGCSGDTAVWTSGGLDC
ncbi:MAG: hypothetical protein ABR613_09020 [Actinomycetota bacterium]